MNITEESCSNDYWKAPNGKTMEEAEIILDLKCPTRLETFSIMNGFGNFGTNKFSLWGAREMEGPWTKLYTGELPPGTEMTEEVTCYLIQNNVKYYIQDILCCESYKEEEEFTTITTGATTQTTTSGVTDTTMQPGNIKPETTTTTTTTKNAATNTDTITGSSTTMGVTTTTELPTTTDKPVVS